MISEWGAPEVWFFESRPVAKKPRLEETPAEEAPVEVEVPVDPGQVLNVITSGHRCAFGSSGSTSGGASGGGWRRWMRAEQLPESWASP